MPGRILIADDMATSRIILKARLATAAYDIVQCASGAETLAMACGTPPDLVVLGDSLRDLDPFTLCTRLRELPGVGNVPVLLISARADRAMRIAALEAGIDTVLDRMPENDSLRAWVRNLMRRRAAEQELSRDKTAATHLGFAEGLQAPFAGPGQVALIAPTIAAGQLWRKRLAPLIRDRIDVLNPQNALTELNGKAHPDAIVVADIAGHRGSALGLLSDLRCRSETHRAAIILVQDRPDRDVGVMALDLGVDDLVETGFEGPDMALRLRRELARKARTDTYRAALQNGLRLAAIDPLTGLYNRRYAISELSGIIAEAQTKPDNFAVMMLDLDRFKRINDSHGHAAGDAVLTEVARRMNGCLRRGDFLARIGGEEFLAVIRECKPAAARHAAERLRKVVSATPVELPGGDSIQVTLSIGLVIGGATGAGLQDADRLIDQADQALYAAKADGRNQVMLHQTAA